MKRICLEGKCSWTKFEPGVAWLEITSALVNTRSPKDSGRTWCWIVKVWLELLFLLSLMLFKHSFHWEVVENDWTLIDCIVITKMILKKVIWRRGLHGDFIHCLVIQWHLGTCKLEINQYWGDLQVTQKIYGDFWLGDGWNTAP